jgi:L-asparaginase II
MSGPPRVEFRRQGRIEAAHELSVIVCDGDGRRIAFAGDAAARTYWRSAAKPFQAIPFVASGGAAAFGLGDAELALLCASHSAEAGHRAAAARILAAAGLVESDLLCGVHPPMWAAGWRALAEGGGPPTAIWNNCSGKHAGMLACCRHRGWPLVDYRHPQHPLQGEIRAVVLRLCGEPPERVVEAVDGCGVPAFHLSLAGMATAYARLAGGGDLPDAWREAARRLLAAAAAQPWFLAGTDRLCTRLAEVSAGAVIGKGGAMGIYCAVLRERGWGVALKVADGSGRAAEIALIETLRQLEALPELALAALAPYGASVLQSQGGAPVAETVSDLRLAFA